MTFAETLLQWYDLNKRSLPWRDVHDPYRTWLSEIMLQQTQTETVKGYYARFLDRFPTVQALAQAPEDDVLKLWEGLGYYSRARNLRKAAQMIVSDFGGRFPTCASDLKKLPGIGPYVANAIASITYNECVPALDGNQARVLSRILAYESIIKTPFDLKAPAMTLISPLRPGDYNQALMDLGAGICTPRNPKCHICPVSAFCQALDDDACEEFPRKAPPLLKREENWCIVPCFHCGNVLLHKRPKGLLGGLYEFCAIPEHPTPDALPGILQALGFGSVRILHTLPPAKHVFTHLIWRMQGYIVEVSQIPDGYIPVSPDALDQYAFPTAIRWSVEATFGRTDSHLLPPG